MNETRLEDSIREAFLARLAAEKAEQHHFDLIERSFGEGWDNDPTGCLYISSASTRAQKAHKTAKEKLDAAARALGVPTLTEDGEESDEVTVAMSALSNHYRPWDAATQAHYEELEAKYGRLDVTAAHLAEALEGLRDRYVPNDDSRPEVAAADCALATYRRFFPSHS